MKTTEILDALASAGMRESEVSTWLASRQKPVLGTIESIFPVVYKNGNNFEILPYLDLGRKDEIWGYELFPGVVIAKKCGCDGNVDDTSWYSCKAFAESISLNGKKGYLPSRDVLKKHCETELRDNIKAMDTFLCDNGVDGENKYNGMCYCSVVSAYTSVYYFNLKGGNVYCTSKDDTDLCVRLAVAF